MSADFIESNLISRLERFKKSGTRYEFRCPYCGDGKSIKSRRGNLYQVKGEYVFNCYNCSQGRSLKNFIKDHFPDLSRFFFIQSLQHKVLNEVKQGHKSVEQDSTWFHPAETSIVAIEYLKSRGVIDLTNIGYTGSAPSEILGKRNGLYDQPCVVFPLKSIRSNEFIGYQLRSVNPTKLRYSTICYEKSYYGEMNESPIMVEGIFDALSINNGIAVLGSGSSVSVKNSIWFLDQEPHNKEIVKKVKKLIESGETVTMLPKQFRGKDANDMLKSGMSRSDIEALVRENSFSGLKAKIKLVEWIE